MRHVMALATIVALSGCASTSWRMEYLEEGVGRVTQDEVALKMGPPTSAQSVSTGEAIWLYHYTSADVHQTWCHEYVLQFDSQKILRQWKRDRC